MEKTKEKKKLLELPEDVIEILSILANQERKSTKALMESLLIEAARKAKNQINNNMVWKKN